MIIDDRFTRGIFAGTVGAVAQNLYIYLAHLLGFTSLHYEDYAEMLIFLKLQKGAFPTVMGLIGHFIWDIFLGIIFVYIIKSSSSRFYLVKGVVYGILIWFFVKVVMTLFRMPIFSSPSTRSTLIFLIGAVFYGLVIAYVLKLTDIKKKYPDLQVWEDK